MSRKNDFIKHEFCHIGIVPPFIFPLNCSNLDNFEMPTERTIKKKSKIEIISALAAKQLPNENHKEFCGTPCRIISMGSQQIDFFVLF